MYKTISKKIIKKIESASDLLNFITDENEELPIKDWVKKYRNVVPIQDIFWLLLREEFLSEKDLRLFAVWRAREFLKLIENPDERSVNACNVAERYANGQTTKEELDAASDAAEKAYSDLLTIYDVPDVASAAVSVATYDALFYSFVAYATSIAASDLVYFFSYSISIDIAHNNILSYDVQLDKLLTYFD
jgi:hypothetical protein